MAMTGVLRPGHSVLRVRNLEQSAKFYAEVLGLIETGRDRSGRVYFKCWDERDHNSLVLVESDRPGMECYGFKVLDRPTLEGFSGALKAAGFAVERIPEGELLETGERIRFEAPTGHLFELYADKADIGNGLGYVNPEVLLPNRRGIAPARLDHWQLHGADLDGSRDLFTEILGFTVAERLFGEDGKTDFGVWMTCSSKVHDIAFVRDDRNNTLHHVSYYLDTWEQVLNAADVMAINRVQIDIGPTRHGITRGATIYAFDPSGNRFETFCGGYASYPDMQPIHWTWEERGSAIFYHDRKLNERFLSMVT